jgi:hypothetical protein
VPRSDPPGEVAEPEPATAAVGGQEPDPRAVPEAWEAPRTDVGAGDEPAAPEEFVPPEPGAAPLPEEDAAAPVPAAGHQAPAAPTAPLPQSQPEPAVGAAEGMGAGAPGSPAGARPAEEGLAAEVRRSASPGRIAAAGAVTGVAVLLLRRLRR